MQLRQLERGDKQQHQHQQHPDETEPAGVAIRDEQQQVMRQKAKLQQTLIESQQNAQESAEQAPQPHTDSHPHTQPHTKLALTLILALSLTCTLTHVNAAHTCEYAVW